MNYTILLWIGALPVFLVGQIYLLGRRMSAPEKMMRPTPNGLSAQQREVVSRYNEWLTSVNLEFRTTFQFGASQAAVFQQKDQPRFFSFLPVQVFRDAASHRKPDYYGTIPVGCYSDPKRCQAIVWGSDLPHNGSSAETCSPLAVLALSRG